MFSKEEASILWPFYLEAFLGTILLVNLPFMVLYFSSIGLEAWQIGILMAATPLAMLIFEIPTGAIADLYGRKFSVMLGWSLAGILSIFIYFLSGFFSIFVFLFLTGIAFTLASGSYEAWVVDLLNAKKKNLVSAYFSKKQSLYNLAFILSGVIGAFLVGKFGLRVIWPASGIAFLLSVFFLYFGEEVYEKKKVNIKESFRQVFFQIKSSFSYGYKHHVLFYLLAVSAIFGVFVSMSSQISWTPFLKSFGMPDSWIGYLWSISGVIGIIAPVLSHRLSRKYSQRNLMISASFFTLIIGICALFSMNLAFAFIIVLMFYLAGDFDAPLSNSYFHKFAKSKLRATLGSIKSMLFSLAGIIGSVLAGFLVSGFGGKITLFISSLLMIPVIFLYLRIRD